MPALEEGADDGEDNHGEDGDDDAAVVEKGRLLAWLC